MDKWKSHDFFYIPNIKISIFLNVSKKKMLKVNKILFACGLIIYNKKILMLFSAFNWASFYGKLDLVVQCEQLKKMVNLQKFRMKKIKVSLAASNLGEHVM